jgi:hypothetical protein
LVNPAPGIPKAGLHPLIRLYPTKLLSNRANTIGCHSFRMNVYACSSDVSLDTRNGSHHKLSNKTETVKSQLFLVTSSSTPQFDHASSAARARHVLGGVVPGSSRPRSLFLRPQQHLRVRRRCQERVQRHASHHQSKLQHPRREGQDRLGGEGDAVLERVRLHGQDGLLQLL